MVADKAALYHYLLFAISIKLLAQLIREDNGIKGIVINEEEHKLSLYADDVILYLTKPALTILHLKKQISKLGFYSGYKVNVKKTMAMGINGTVPHIVKLQSGFKWSMEGIKYLGIYIPPSLQNLFDANYSKIIRSINNDLERWSVLPLSLLGRIESIRMNILPRLLYLFQMLPIEIPKSTFDNLKSMMSKFIWQKKRPRIRLKTLQLSKSNGGLKLPNLKYYFWAAQMKPMIAWLQNNTDTCWLNTEKSLCSLKSLQDLPFLAAPIKEMATWTKNTLKIWVKVQSIFGLPTQISSLISFGSLKSFIPNKLDIGFRR